MKIHWITSWYKEQNDERKAELIKCIKNTVESGEVDNVILLSEHCSDHVLFPDATIMRIHKRPTFQDFLLAIKYLTFIEPNDIVVIANTDIYPEKGAFRDSLTNSLTSNDVFALSRYDEDLKGEKTFLDRWDAQDVWCFRTPIRDIACDFPLGYAGSDNAFNSRCYEMGYNISNPSKTIKVNHLHNSGHRTYNPNNKVPMPYLLVTPHTIGEEAKRNYILT